MLGKTVAALLIIVALLGIYKQFHKTVMLPFVSYMQRAIEEFKFAEIKNVEDVLRLWGFKDKK